MSSEESGSQLRRTTSHYVGRNKKNQSGDGSSLIRSYSFIHSSGPGGSEERGRGGGSERGGRGRGNGGRGGNSRGRGNDRGGGGTGNGGNAAKAKKSKQMANAA